MVQNTYLFVAVAALIENAYKDISNYKKYINDNKNNDFLQLGRNLAVHGPTHNIHKKIFIRNIFDADIEVTEINLIDTKCNSNFIVKNYFKL